MENERFEERSGFEDRSGFIVDTKNNVQMYTKHIVKELNNLSQENKRLKSVIRYTHEICLCERFTTNGFDYHEKHPRKERGNGGSRPSTPRDYIENVCGFKWAECGKYPKTITFDSLIEQA